MTYCIVYKHRFFQQKQQNLLENMASLLVPCNNYQYNYVQQLQTGWMCERWFATGLRAATVETEYGLGTLRNPVQPL